MAPPMTPVLIAMLALHGCGPRTMSQPGEQNAVDCATICNAARMRLAQMRVDRYGTSTICVCEPEETQ